MFLWRDGLLELPPPLFFLFFFFLKKNSVVIEEVYFCLCFLVISVVRLALYSCSFSFCFLLCNFCSVLTVSSGQFSRSVMFDSLRPHGLQHARPPCPSSTPGVYSNSCSLSRWYHSAISSSVVLFSGLQSCPASGSFQLSQFFASGGQSIRVSSSTSVLPMNTQDWSPLGWTGWISLQSKGLF